MAKRPFVPPPAFHFSSLSTSTLRPQPSSALCARPSFTLPLRTTPTSSAQPAPTDGVNITKYASQRSLLSSDRSDLTAKEVNDLMVKAGKAPRDLTKWERALDGSYTLVTARLVSDRTLVAFARATSDHALNGTIWDVVTDPALPNQALMKRNVIRYILKDLRRSIPGCSIALFSTPDDMSVFEQLDFVADPDGIRGMALFDSDPDTPHYL